MGSFAGDYTEKQLRDGTMWNTHMGGYAVHVSGESLSQRERGARASGPGEGYHEYFFVGFSICTPHPPLRGTLSRWERGLTQNFFYEF